MTPEPVDLGAPASKDNSLLSTMTRLTGAQYAMLARITAHDEPVTVIELSDEMQRHASSIRGVLDVLVKLGLVTAQPLPSSKRGRPSIGYTAVIPGGAEFPAQMFTEVTGAFFDWLRNNVDNPDHAARSIGRQWGDSAVGMMRVPDHKNFSSTMPGFRLEDHMEKIRMFMNIFAMGASIEPTRPTTLVLTSAPFTDQVNPDPLALEMRRGMVEQVISRTTCDDVTASYLPGPGTHAELILTKTTAGQKEISMIKVRYFAAAAEAAGSDDELIEREELGSSPDTQPSLGELTAFLATRHEGLGKVLDVSSFLVNERPAKADVMLPDDATVDVLPPFAGG